MIFFEILRQMLRTLWAHKLRSFLTMFGIAWGVGSLLLLVGLGEGFRSGNRRELNSLGEDIMFVFPGRAPAVAGNMSSGRSYNLTDEDYQDIVQEAPHVLRRRSGAVAHGHSRGQRLRQHQRRGQRRASALQPDSLPAAVGGTLAQSRTTKRRSGWSPSSATRC